MPGMSDLGRPEPYIAPLEAKDLTESEKKRLLELSKQIFGEDDSERETACLALVDFGPVGAKTLIRFFEDPELRANRKAVWALLHTWSDLISLDVPVELEALMIRSVFRLLWILEDNREFVAWMAADGLATHGRQTRRPKVREFIYQGFHRNFADRSALGQMGAIYGLAALGEKEALPEILSLASETKGEAVDLYLEETVARLRQGSPPGLFEEPVEPSVPPEKQN